MAFLPDEQNLQNQAPQGSGTAQGQAPITSSPAPAAGGAGNKGTINQASSNSAPQPFTNLQTYLSANAPQIQAQGDTISNNLTTQYGQTKGAIDQAGSDFGNTVKQSYTPNDPQVVNNFTADPTKVAADPNATKQFQGMFNDSYTGPGTFEGTGQYGDLVGQVQKGQQTASQVNTQAGLQSYLQGSNPNESAGMATLDSALLQGNPQVQTQIAAAAQPFAGLTDYLGTAAKGANSQIAQAQSEAQAARTAAQGAADTARGNLSGNVNAETASAKAAYQKSVQDYQDYMKALDGENQMKGIAGQIHGVNGGYTVPDIFSELDKPAGGPTLYDQGAVPSAQDYATSKALAMLTGNPALLDDSQAGMAGTWKPTTYTPPDLAALAAQTANPLFSQSGQQIQIDNAQEAQLNALLQQLQQWNGQVPSSVMTSPTPAGQPVLQPPTVNPRPTQVHF